MKKIIIALAVIIALSGGIYGALVLLNQPKPSQTNVQALQQTIEPITVQSLHEAVNAKRREVGVPELILDERLNQSAQLKSDDMNVDGYYGHIDPTTGRHGYEYIPTGINCKGGENLNNYASTHTALQTVQSWYESMPHRDAMLNPESTRVGYGLSGEYITQHLC